MALNTSTGAEVQRPLATVVIAASTSTILTLLVYRAYRGLAEEAGAHSCRCCHRGVHRMKLIRFRHRPRRR